MSVGNSPLNSAIFNLSLESTDSIQELWKTLLDHLNCTHLQTLFCFFNVERGVLTQSEEKSTISKATFIDAVDEIFGKGKYSLHAVSLFDLIDTNQDGKITWPELLDFVLEHSYQTREEIDFSVDKILTLEKTKRQTIMKIVTIEKPTVFCYVVISKYGRVGLYDGKMILKSEYDLVLDEITAKALQPKKRQHIKWVTDAVYLPDTQMLVVTTSARCLVFYDASRLSHMALWIITGMPNAPQCVTYASGQKQSVLLLGDDAGCVTVLTFLQPLVAMLPKKHADKINCFYWTELLNQTLYVTVGLPMKHHNDGITDMAYRADNETLITSSSDIDCSLTISHLTGRRNPYVFKINKGVNCFDLETSIQIVATGGNDTVIRIWNPVVPKQPVAVMRGHRTSVIDLQIMISKEVIVSLSKDAVLKTWDLKEYYCLQSVKIKFPSFETLGKVVEWGRTSIYPGPAYKCSPKVKQDTISSAEYIEQNVESDFENFKIEDEELGLALSSEPSDSDSDQSKSITLVESGQWDRNEMLVSCCDHLAVIKIVDSSTTEFNESLSIVSPPPVNKDVLVPKTWRAAIGEEKCKRKKQAVRKKRVNEDLNDMLKRHGLEDILERDFVTAKGLNYTIHRRIANLDFLKEQMKEKISQCAPYLALTLWPLKELKFSRQNMPVPSRKRNKKMADRAYQMMTDSSLESILLTDRSSFSRSSRSMSTFD